MVYIYICVCGILVWNHAKLGWFLTVRNFGPRYLSP